MQTYSTLSVVIANVPTALLFGTGVVCMLIGMYLRWKLTYHCMEAEEHVKEGRLNEEQVRRRTAFFRFGGPVMILLGISFFAVIFFE